MLFSKKISIILADDFNLADLQRKFRFKLTKINLNGYDLIHQLSFEDKYRPSFVQLFSNQLTKNNQTFYSLVSPVHIYVGMNGLSLTKVLTLPDEIVQPFLERLGLEFGLVIKQLANGFWATHLNIENWQIPSNPDSVYCYIHQNINNTHDNQNLNQIQMFIHQDPIYELSKQYAGEYINSIWFWGASPEKQKFKFKPIFKKTFGRHLYFDALRENFAIENNPDLLDDMGANQFKSNNLLLCDKKNQQLVFELLKKYKRNVVLYYQKTGLQIR